MEAANFAFEIRVKERSELRVWTNSLDFKERLGGIFFRQIIENRYMICSDWCCLPSLSYLIREVIVSCVTTS